MLTQLITKVFTGEAGIFFARMKRLAILYALMAVFALLMVGFLLASLYIWIAESYGSLPTALGFAGVFFLLVLITYIVVVIARRPPHRRADDRLQRDIASIASVAALTNAPTILREVWRRKSLLLVPVAAVGAFGLYRLIAGFRRR